MRPLEAEDLERYANEYGVAPIVAQRDYAACRIAFAISRDKTLCDSVAFKGGFVLRNGYHSARASKDIDATVGRKAESLDTEQLRTQISRRCKDLQLRFQRSPVTTGVDSIDLGTIGYRGPLGAAKLVLELSRREDWIRPLSDVRIDRFSIPSFTIRCLCLEEMIAEQWRFLLQRSPNRPGDPYDLWDLWERVAALQEASGDPISETTVRDLVPRKVGDGSLSRMEENLGAYRRGWERERGNVLPEDAPDFEVVAIAVRDAARTWTAWK